MKQLRVMKEHSDQQLDKLARKVVKQAELERPSLDFTANVMAAVEASELSHITVYKPLISKRAWFVVASLCIAAFAYLFYFGGAQDLGWLDKVDYSLLSDNKITDALGSVTFSKILMYAIVLFGLVWFIQISLIKNLLDKRLEY